MPGSGISSEIPSASDLLARLRALQRDCADRPQPERREALVAWLREAVGSLPEEAARALVAELRRAVAHEARSLTHAPPDARAEIATLQAENTALRAERRALSEEAVELRARNSRLAADDVTMQAGPDSSAKAASDGSDRTQRLRAGLHEFLQGKSVTPESVGIHPGDKTVFRLVTQIFRFVDDLEMIRARLEADFNFEPGVPTDTQMGLRRKLHMRKLLAAVLDGQEEALDPLVAALRENKRFLMALGSGIAIAVPEGTRLLLKDLDPERLLAENPSRFGTNFEKAWRAFARLHNDLVNLTDIEVYGRFFDEPFRKRFEDPTPKGRP